ncbi:MAG: glutamate synthase-related protein [Methanomassiliicoccales archaeon]
MFECYHIHVEAMSPISPPVPKYIIERGDNCMNCGKCEKACVYGVHKRREDDPRKMADPISQSCKNCFRCIQECQQRALKMSVNPRWKKLGRGVWTPSRITTMWNEAETGRIPVFGAGYRGMFAGPGFDSMWTDMSEIVRPTRDGIHGREFISTSIDLGKKVAALEFSADGGLKTEAPEMITLPIPIMLDATRLYQTSPQIIEGIVEATKGLNTLLFIRPKDLPTATGPQIVPVISNGDALESIDWNVARLIELELAPGWQNRVATIRTAHPGVLVSLRTTLGPSLSNELDSVVREADALHVIFDEEGLDQTGKHAMDSLRDLHRSLVKKGVRDEITIIASGGISAAEHVPKSIICGADAVCLESALLVALECRYCPTCQGAGCGIHLRERSPAYVNARVTNMVSAWRDQMLEMLGAMGIREVRRLRGETGRAIFQEEVEREVFAEMTGGDSNG